MNGNGNCSGKRQRSKVVRERYGIYSEMGRRWLWQYWKVKCDGKFMVKRRGYGEIETIM